VTIPYKEQVIPFLSSVNDVALEIGAVNTIQLKDGKLLGSNTDVSGFMQSISKVMDSHHSRALVLGTGGSSKAVVYGLKKMGLEYRLVSRKPESENEIRYDDLDRNLIRQFTVIVNTTPLGMFPNTDQCPPLPYECLTSSHLLFDLVYNPEETLFLKKGKAAGATTKNGLEMLQLQAERSWQTWNS
jgi:shikimate dehydrogenase